MAENYVLQALLPAFETPPRYWAQNNPPHEADFLLQHKSRIVPAEVKAGVNVSGKSLRWFGEKFGSPLRARFSLENLRLDGNVLNIPLYLADETPRLLDLALSKAP